MGAANLIPGCRCSDRTGRTEKYCCRCLSDTNYRSMAGRLQCPFYHHHHSRPEPAYRWTRQRQQLYKCSCCRECTTAHSTDATQQGRLCRRRQNPARPVCPRRRQTVVRRIRRRCCSGETRCPWTAGKQIDHHARRRRNPSPSGHLRVPRNSLRRICSPNFRSKTTLRLTA